MKILLRTLVLIFTSVSVQAQQYLLKSPDTRISVTISIGQQVSYQLSLDDKPVGSPSFAAIAIDKLKSTELRVKKTTKQTVNQVIHPVVPEKRAAIKDEFNELRILFRNNLLIAFRAYNKGVAYRWESTLADSVKIMYETVELGFSPGDQAWYPSESGFHSHNERLYRKHNIREITKDSLASLPTLVNHAGISLLVSEADLYDYPGMWVTGNGNDRLVGVFPPHASKEKQRGDRDMMVTATDDFIAKTWGIRSFPWRVIVIGKKEVDLLDNTLVYQLSRSTQEDYSWIKPGKVAWDWWNALNVYGVDFKSGVNTTTYKYYVDFAAKFGLEYIILDEGWSPTTDITRTVDALDMPELISYAKEKNVGIILWVVWLALDKQMQAALDLYESWGIKGIKVDFMQRDDQEMVNFYERTAREAAKRKLLVDFHGSYKPTGLERLYPNAITREGVMGMEWSKWDLTKSIGPEHNLTLPFIRNAVGPMDYTPGAMLNAQRNAWAPVFQRPMSLGTRCHQLAMYVIFTSPLQMLADAPSNYYREPECMDFLSSVPAVWQETAVLDGKTGDYVAIAKKSLNGDWYVGAMTDWSARDILIDFSFLEEGDHNMDCWQDGINADRNAIDYAKHSTTVNNTMKQTVHLAPGGGWVARIRK
jgi:alpha-glucosidase